MDIRTATRKQYSAEKKIRIMLKGLRGDVAAAGSLLHVFDSYTLPLLTERVAPKRCCALRDSFLSSAYIV